MSEVLAEHALDLSTYRKRRGKDRVLALAKGRRPLLRLKRRLGCNEYAHSEGFYVDYGLDVLLRWQPIGSSTGGRVAACSELLRTLTTSSKRKN